MRNAKGGLIVFSNGTSVEGTELYLRRTVQEGEIIFVLQVPHVFIEPCRKQEDGELLPDQYLECTGKFAHGLRVGNLIDFDEHTLSLALDALKHPCQRHLHIGDRSCIRDLESGAEKRQIDVCMPEELGEPVLAGKL